MVPKALNEPDFVMEPRGIYWSMAVCNNNKYCYEPVPKSVETSQGGNVTILWNQQAQTDRTVPNNKPDIIIRDNEKGTYMLIDVVISGDRNVIKRSQEDSKI